MVCPVQRTQLRFWTYRANVSHGSKHVRGARKGIHTGAVKKILLCEPTYGQIDYQAHDNRLDFYMAMARDSNGYEFHTGNIGRFVVHVAREDMATYALNNGFDMICFVDDDMLIPKDAFHRLAAHDLPIVGALAFQRVPPFHPVIYRDKRDPDTGLVSFDTITDYPKDTLFDHGGQIGFGVVVIQVEVFRKVPRPWFSAWSPVGEDIFFCYKARETAGAKTYVDTSVKVQHLGDRPAIGEEQFLEYRQKGYITIHHAVTGPRYMALAEA